MQENDWQRSASKEHRLEVHSHQKSFVQKKIEECPILLYQCQKNLSTAIQE